MSTLILHHHDPSPFAEKIRLVFGLKKLAWSSVEIPMVMPKPDLTALTGGYRKTPVLQTGSDIYCDTRAIARRLDELHPEPSLFPHGSETLAMALGHWSDSVLFSAGAALSMGTNRDIPREVLDDRLAFFDFLDESSLAEPLDGFYAQFTAGLEMLEQLLGDGRSWMLGDSASWADLSCYAPVWMCRANIAGSEALLAPFGALRRWEERVADLGHGQRSTLSPDSAFEAARESSDDDAASIAGDAWPALPAGTEVSVSATDYGREPSHGLLHCLDRREIVILRDDPRAGRVRVHFPREGYRVEALS